MLGGWRERLRAYAEKDGRGYPDWIMRYGPIVRRLRQTGRIRPARIVEIGANENGFARFSGLPVIALDVARDHLNAVRETQSAVPVLGDITALPFAEGTVDLCLCIDTYEHLSPEQRARATEAICSMLAPSGCAVISFPTGEDAIRAENTVRRAYHRYTGGQLKWLEEHAVHRLPDADEMASLFRERLSDSHTVTIMSNANVAVWTFVWRVLMCGWPGRGNSVAQILLRWGAPLLARAHVGRCYRAVLWVEPRSA